MVNTVGIPHYDKYVTRKPTSRTDVITSLGGDPRKPLILYIPLCDYRLAENNVDRYVMELLGAMDALVVVRFPPAETVNIAGYEKTPNVIFDRPGHVFREDTVGNRDLTPEDDDRYMDVLHAADVVVGGPSTFAIDAAVFDTPIVLVDFYPNVIREEEKIYEYRAEHFMRVLRSNGAQRARTKEAFVKLLARYLKDRSLEREGRKKIVVEQCFRIDGKSSERVAEAILHDLRR